MVETNLETMEIVISETLSFSRNIEPIFDEIQKQLTDDLADEFINEDVKDKVERFVNHNLTSSDKRIMLDVIGDDIRESYYSDISIVDVFDKESIRNSIYKWIEGEFDFTPDNVY